MAKKKRPIEQDQEVEQLKSTPIKSSVTKGAPSNAAPQPETKSNSSDSSSSTPSLSAFELKPTCMQTSSSRKATVRSPREKKPVDGTGRWSPEDETALLNAVIQYKLQNGSDPSSNWGAFLDYIKKYVSLQRKELTKSALSKKVTKFKKDYLSKMERKRNEGEDENQVFVFSNPIEQDLFYLCDKAWGSENQKISLKIGNPNPRKKANLGQAIEESPAKKSRRNGVRQEKGKEKEDNEKGSVKKSIPNPGVILALPFEESPAKKRKKSEVKKQKKLAMEEVEKDDDEKKTKKKVKVTDANEDDDNDEEEEEEDGANEDDDQKKAEKVKVKEDVVVVEKEVADANDDDDDDDDDDEEEEEEEDGANEDDDEMKAEKEKGKEVTDATEDDDDDDEEDKDDDANEVNDEEEKRKKNENMKETVVVVEEEVVSANEDDDEEEEEDNEKKGKDTVVDMDLWGKYPLVLDSMERKFASMEKAGFGNVSTLREACKGSIDKIEEGKLKNWESRWREQKRAELESFASKKTLEKEQMDEWLDILQR